MEVSNVDGDKWEISRKRVTLEKVIGSGSFGTVWRAVLSRGDGQPGIQFVAAKCFSRQCLNNPISFMYDLIPAPFYLSLHVNLHDSGNRIEIEGQKIFPSKNVSVLKIKHEYNDTQNNTNNNNNNNNNSQEDAADVENRRKKNEGNLLLRCCPTKEPVQITLIAV